MRVMVIVKATKNSEAGEMPSQEFIATMGAFNQRLIAAGVMLDGGGLKPSKNSARVSLEGPTPAVSLGPFVLLVECQREQRVDCGTRHIGIKKQARVG